MNIETGVTVSVGYKLTTTVGGESKVVEETTKDTPLTFTYGGGKMLPAFEFHLWGLKEGDKFSFNIAPNQAYGESSPANMMEVDVANFHTMFPNQKLEVGHVIPVSDMVQGTILEVKPESVKIDFNHPMAGKKLHFEGEIYEVKKS